MVTGTCAGHEPDTGASEFESGPVSRGSITAFAAFYRAEQGRLFHYFRRKVGREAAPDLVQEAFTRMFRSGAYGRVEHPQAYLMRTAHNLLIERARRWHRKERMLFPLDEARDAAVVPDQERQFEAMELRRAFRTALLAMPRRTRRIFLMHRLRGLTYAQIAEQLGLSIKAVEKHIGRALKRCRKVAARFA
ncbi:RNA polymerase sigma factor [Sphingopyxis witflariensis]|uniref:RNA polymerase subunit sigma-24 n=1 Tax=Sphingopyxis witflariensis TaxID=173675 RepID=A0A246K458_9SPHN|nr:sigma-70 family RNA polymerase sigma factor [Sphingopyxis witflariensis]OWR00212.1 RNA polymerase subunit sigma-24 [Sphingopyxis witflariensis]